LIKGENQSYVNFPGMKLHKSLIKKAGTKCVGMLAQPSANLGNTW